MKTMKKFASLLLALAMIFSLATTAFALDKVVEGDGTASITIENAAKGETYKIYKLFDATVSTAQTNGESTSISYTGEIPDSLKAYFEKDSGGYISLKANVTDDALFAALKTWAKDDTSHKISEAMADGTALVFKNIPYGYYVITSTQDGGTMITVDSTKPNAIVKDKNTTIPKALEKTVDGTDYNIGDTITYTVKFKTANWNQDKKITEYTITDTLPTGVTLKEVTSITIDGEAYTVNDKVPQFDKNGKIAIPWVDNNQNFKYANGAEVVITYTAVLNENAVIDGEGNTNKVEVTWGDEKKLEDTETVYTYAIALKKVDQAGQPLAGATFQFPFYVKDVDGEYIYAGTTAGDNLTNTITSPDDGVIIIKGVTAGTYEITETKAPDGYNKLTNKISVTAVKTGSKTTTTKWYIDADGNKVTDTTNNATTVNLDITEFAASAELVVNKTGTELPSTGGMGTTLFYVVGGILVAAAAVLLVTKKRMAN